MKYKEILSRIAKENNTTPFEVEKEMQDALRIANIDCNVEDFIIMVSSMVLQEKIKIDYK